MMTPTLLAIPLAEVVESPRNARRHYDPAKLDELAASLQSDGQLTPCLVRPNTDLGGYELAAGHRRRRAAEMAGLATLLCLARDMSDEEFLRTLVRENQDREDLHPLDEALGFQQLLELPGYDVAAVAAALGKSASYVYGRLHLAHLIPAAQKAFLADTFPVSHALLIARATSEQQEKALELVVDWSGQPKPYDRFRDELQRQFHADLKGVPWKLDDATLLPQAGACLTCPKRSGTLPDLFHDIRGQNVCTDTSCHDAKRKAHVARSVADAEAAGAPLVQITARYSEKLPAPGRPVPPKWWKAAKKKDDGAVKAIDVQSGHTTYVVLSLPKDLEKARKRAEAKREAPARGEQDQANRKARAERETAFRRFAAERILAQHKAIEALDAVEVLWTVARESFGLGHQLEIGEVQDLDVVASLLGWPAPPTNLWDRELMMREWRESVPLDARDLRILLALLLADDVTVGEWQVRGAEIEIPRKFAWVAALVGHDLAAARKEWEAAEQRKLDELAAASRAEFAANTAKGKRAKSGNREAAHV